MNKHFITLPKGKYISEIEPFFSNGLWTNSNFQKTVPNCGFSQFVISYLKQCAIIIPPNVPVIQGKEEDHNRTHPKNEEILGVYKGVDVDDIKAYLLRDDIIYKKILTTPEGFVDKVLKAFTDLNDLYDNWFLLLDESERIITDVSYRGKIAAPLKSFFKFKNKALVSATTLPFSDKRFESFDHYEIVPDYDYSKTLTLINSNNVVASIKKLLDKMNSEHVCIFFNSTSGINAIAKNLDLYKDSQAFCAQDSVVKLMEMGFKNATSTFDKKLMAKYNFFTSRYFSAFDIVIKEYKPDVIMVTDVYFADHSILDPQTECIQIPGRFRKGINSLTHITNIKPELQYKTREETLSYLNGCFDTYEWFVHEHANAVNPGSRDSFQKAIENSPAHAYYSEGELNSAMVDNTIHEERVKSYYQNIDSLKAAYDALPLHFRVEHLTDVFPVGDGDLFNLHIKQTRKERYQAVAELFYKWTPRFDYFPMGAMEMRNKLAAKYPKIELGFNHLGLTGLAAINYDLSKINRAVEKSKRKKELERVSNYVYKTFNEHSSPNENDISQLILKAFSEANSWIVPGAATILKFFNGRRSTAGGVNVYILKDKVEPGSR
jgi:hypothetical protein